MAENQKRILEMLKDRKITVEEAERLLSLIGSAEERGELPAGVPAEKKRAPKYLRVMVSPEPDESDGERVNVRVPLSLIRAGMKFSALIPPFAADKVRDALKEQGVDFDIRSFKPDDVEELVEALSDLEVNVEGGKEKVRVFVE